MSKNNDEDILKGIVEEAYSDLDMPLSQLLSKLIERLQIKQSRFAFQSNIDVGILNRILNRTENRHLSRKDIIGIIEGIEMSKVSMARSEIRLWQVALQCTAAAERVLAKITPKGEHAQTAHLVFARRELVSSMRQIWEETQGHLPMTLELPKAVEIALTWMRKPKDLDLVVIGTSQTEVLFCVNFRARGMLDGFPFCKLDRDVTDGFGPETITIMPDDGVKYDVFVHNYSREIPLSASNCTVAIRHGSRMREFHCPSAEDKKMWHVADIKIVNGRVDIEEVNQLVSDELYRKKQNPNDPSNNQHL